VWLACVSSAASREEPAQKAIGRNADLPTRKTSTPDAHCDCHRWIASISGRASTVCRKLAKPFRRLARYKSPLREIAFRARAEVFLLVLHSRRRQKYRYASAAGACRVWGLGLPVKPVAESV